MSRKKAARTFRARVTVMPRRAVLDPQGKAIEQALGRLGHKGVADVRAGKQFELLIEAEDRKSARAMVGEMAERLLANPIMEDWSVAVDEAKSAEDER